MLLFPSIAFCDFRIVDDKVIYTPPSMEYLKQVDFENRVDLGIQTTLIFGGAVVVGAMESETVKTLAIVSIVCFGIVKLYDWITY